jgi:hypothetical protein
MMRPGVFARVSATICSVPALTVVKITASGYSASTFDGLRTGMPPICTKASAFRSRIASIKMSFSGPPFDRARKCLSPSHGMTKMFDELLDVCHKGDFAVDDGRPWIECADESDDYRDA